MKPFSFLLLGLVSIVATIPPPPGHPCEPTRQPSGSADDGREARRATGNLAAWATQIRATASRSGSGPPPAAGNLWIEVDRLQRQGLNVRGIEYYTADLERSLRAGPEDAAARRHILNNLDYEIDALRRRMRR